MILALTTGSAACRVHDRGEERRRSVTGTRPGIERPSADIEERPIVVPVAFSVILIAPNVRNPASNPELSLPSEKPPVPTVNLVSPFSGGHRS